MRISLGACCFNDFCSAQGGGIRILFDEGVDSNDDYSTTYEGYVWSMSDGKVLPLRRGFE